MKLSWGELHRQVLLTLSYSQVFHKPLTAEEIWLRLLSFKSSSVSRLEDVQVSLDQLKDSHLIIKKSEYWQLATGSEDLPNFRKKRMRLSAMKMEELRPFISFAQYIPWIRGVAITGSVSVDNADAKDDVDLMIVTQSGRLWLVRPLLVLFSFIKGKRRSWNKEEYNSWCLNLWLEETSLQVVPEKQSIYTAYEVCQARWVLVRHNIEQTFLLTNAWVNCYLPNYFNKRVFERNKHPTQRLQGVSVVDSVLRLLNSLSYLLQRLYMQRHMTTERVGETYAFFHPRDTKKNIITDWQRLLRRL